MAPIAIAWRIAARCRVSLTGAPLPSATHGPVEARLVGGSVLFGAGRVIAGPCPGPAIASIGYSGMGGVIFLLAMVAAMLATARIAHRNNGVTAWTSDP